MSSIDLETFGQAYIGCALWASTTENGEPLDSEHDSGDIAPETKAQMLADCADFQTANTELLSQWYEQCGESTERAGHDFWLTRNRHGAGFWDRWASGTPQAKIGQQLTDAAHAYGSYDLYIGDDGLIYGQ